MTNFDHEYYGRLNDGLTRRTKTHTNDGQDSFRNCCKFGRANCQPGGQFVMSPDSWLYFMPFCQTTCWHGPMDFSEATMGRKVIHGMPMWSAKHITCLFFASLPLLKGVVVEGGVNVIIRTARSEVRRCHENSKTPPCLVRNGRSAFPIPCQLYLAGRGIGAFSMARPSHAIKKYH